MYIDEEFREIDCWIFFCNVVIYREFEYVGFFIFD